MGNDEVQQSMGSVSLSQVQIPTFSPHRFLRGGHLQTIASIRREFRPELSASVHRVPVSEGDSIVLHQNRPEGWRSSDPSMLLVHGISGCHAAPYMIRLAHLFLARGVEVYRMDMRGCGAGSEWTRNLTHAGRSDDIAAALERIASDSAGSLMAVGVSLGGNQLLRVAGRIGAGLDAVPTWFNRLARIAVVAPPVDLQRCSDNMQRLICRPYNHYFIRALLKRAPKLVRQRSDYQAAIAAGRPRTLFELDDRITGPLSGFDGARDYYAQSSACFVSRYNQVPTLVLAAQDDPIVPIDCFGADENRWPTSTRLVLANTGGHVGFVQRDRTSWMDQCLESWFT